MVIGAGTFTLMGNVNASVVSHSTSCKTSGGVKVTDALICKGLRYFAGKTVSLIAGGNPGGSFDALSRSIQPELQSYLGATVNVVDITSSTTAQNEVASASPNGMTLGLLNMVPDAVGVATHQPVVNFNPAKETIYGAEGANADMFLASKSSPFQTLGDLINKTSASNPVKELALASGFDTSVQLLTNAAFGIHANIISGYPNESLLVAGFQRGDGQLMFGPLTSTGPLLTGNQANSVAIAKSAPQGSTFFSAVSKVPIVAALEKQYPAKTSQEKLARVALNAFIPAGAQVIFSAAKTPDYIARTLTAAMYWTVRTPQEKQAALLHNLTPGWQSPQKMRETYVTMETLAPKLASVFAGF